MKSTSMFLWLILKATKVDDSHLFSLQSLVKHLKVCFLNSVQFLSFWLTWSR